tara:strand:+ start:578 stop:820 length:243 start_codon:yes stop_codon:yes gene_type:complete
MTWQDDLTNTGLRQSVIRNLMDVFSNNSDYTFSSIKKSLEERGVKRLKSSNLRKYLDNADWIMKKETTMKDAAVLYKKRV